ncbi:MAG: type III-B CRISPR module RAMP protein Cmr4 [Mariprofundaceae bacterium]|nr:type III-B CRISPR module RAMP protein Cmr4 [Mariprofundaceae bacterium]
MFEAKKAMLMYCTSPVHAGAGQAFGLIDNPIQRERHSEHPVIAGSGVKGALRHHLYRQWANNDEKQTKDLLNRIFGPESGESSDYAGAISFSDAQLLVFPIRCVKNGFVYATSPLCLARAQRLLAMCGVQTRWQIDEVKNNSIVTLNPELLSGDSILLETQQFKANKNGNDDLKAIAENVAELALPDDPAYAYFRDKLKKDLVLLSDTDFNYFVKHATVVEAHVCIDEKTGTAKDGSLHYTENLPPESILISAAMATVERKKGGVSAEAMLAPVTSALDKATIQIGGDATTGRGQVILNLVGGNHG